MDQLKLIHEDIFEALGTDIQALGGNKVVGAKLWPEKSPSKAGELLANCLNRSRPEKLDPEQQQLIIRDARQVGSYAAMHFLCGDAGFADPVPVEPEDEMARLQREFIDAVRTQQSQLKSIERLSNRMQKPVKVMGGHSS